MPALIGNREELEAYNRMIFRVDCMLHFPMPFDSHRATFFDLDILGSLI